MKSELMRIIQENIDHIVETVLITVAENPELSEHSVELSDQLRGMWPESNEIARASEYLQSQGLAYGLTLEIKSVENFGGDGLGLIVKFNSEISEPDEKETRLLTFTGRCAYCGHRLEVTKEVDASPYVWKRGKKKYLYWGGGYEPCTCVDENGKTTKVLISYTEEIPG